MMKWKEINVRTPLHRPTRACASYSILQEVTALRSLQLDRTVRVRVVYGNENSSVLYESTDYNVPYSIARTE
jgi:hypothetical protein